MKKLMKITTITILFFFAGYHTSFSMPKASQAPKVPAPFQAAPALQTKTPSAVLPTIPTSATNLGIPTQTPPQDSGPQQALSEVKKTMEEINTLKDDLKNKLKELDAKLYEARKAAVEGKKVSFEILQQDGQRSARDTFDKVKEKLTTIKNTQTFVQSSFTREFNQKIAEFNSLITKLQSKTQAFAAVKALPQQTVPAQAAATQASQVKTIFAQTKPAASFTSKDSSVTNSIMQILSGATAQIVTWIKQAKNWLLQSSEPISQKKTKQTMTPPTATSAKTMNTQTTNQKTGGPTATPVDQQSITLPVATNPQMLQEQLPMFDSLVKEIDATRLQLNERYQDIKKTQKIMYTHLQQYPELQDSMQPPSKHLHESDTIKKWKNTIIIIFSKVLDAVVWSISKFIEITQYAYNKFISPFVNKFTKDVQEKVIIIEKQQKSA